MATFTSSTLTRQFARPYPVSFRPLLSWLLLALGLLAMQPGRAQGFSTTATPWALPAGGYATSSHDYSYHKLANTVSASSVSALEHTWATLDMNGDTKPDLVVLTEGNGSYNEPFGTGSGRYWKVYLNTGGGFAPTATTWALPGGGRIVTGSGRSASFDALEYVGTSYTGNQSWAVKDMNGDSRPDLVVLTEGNGTYNEAFGTGTSRYWKVYLNTSTGFSSASTAWALPAGGYTDGYGHNYSFVSLEDTPNGIGNPQGWFVKDMTGDGKPDLVTPTENYLVFGANTNAGGRYWKVYLNTGAGYSSTSISWTLPAGGYTYTTGGVGSTTYYASFNSYIHRLSSSYKYTGDQEWSMVDMSGDGRPDLVITTEFDGTYLEPFGTGTARYWKVYLNTGTGFSTTATTWTLPAGGGINPGTGRPYSFNWLSGIGSQLIGNQTWDIQDLTGDSRPDLVILREGTGTYDDVFGTGANRYWKVYANTGTGYAAAATTWGLPAGGYIGSNHSYSFSDLTYSTTSNMYVGSQTWATLDINGDAKADLVVLTEQGTTYNEPFGTGTARYWKAYLNSATGLATRTTFGAVSLELFPNPAQHAFTLRLPALGTERTAQLTLFNNLGQVMQARSLELRPGGTDTQMDVSTLAAGLYTVRVQAGSQTAAQQVVVE